jgi:predicted Zn-dependent protease with MMP-like domain
MPIAHPRGDLRLARWSRRTRTLEREAYRLERLLAEAESLVYRGDRKKDVLACLANLPPGPFMEPLFHLRAGDCFQHIGRLDEAEAHYQAALGLDARSSDALHGLGLVHQARGKQRETVDVWLRVREMDLATPAFPWSLSPEELTAAAESALDEIPKSTRELLENLPILAASYPSEALIRDGVDPRTLGIITGIPYSQKLALLDSLPEVDCVQLFQRNIERICSSREEVLKEIRITVLHETGHYFGLSEEDLEDMGLG